jgi:hypothetical protein
MQKLSEFFEISMDRLLNVTFKELLPVEIADTPRYERVEKKIGKARRA